MLNVQVHIIKPLEDPIPYSYRPEGWINSEEELKEYMEKYVSTYFTQKSTVKFENGKIELKKADVTYTYGDRLTNYRGINQLDVAVDAIRKAIEDNRQTRRIVLSLVDPELDISKDTEKMEIPCFTQYWIYNRKEREKWVLHASMFLRSHDALRAFPANSYAGAKILEYLAENTFCEVGTLTMFFGSCHIYMDF